MIVKAGKSPGEKAQMTQALGAHVQLQAQAMQLGMDGILADANTLYKTQMLYLKMSGIEDAESLAIDPASPSAQQAAQGKAQQAQAMAQAQQRITDLTIQLEQAKIAEDGRQADQANATKIMELEAKIEMAIAELTAKGTLELEKQSREAAQRAAEISAQLVRDRGAAAG